MSKFRVRRIERVEVYAFIEAESEQEAKELFDQYYPGLSNFAGNGGVDKIVGVYPSDEIDYSCEPIEDYRESEVEKSDI